MDAIERGETRSLSVREVDAGQNCKTLRPFERKYFE